MKRTLGFALGAAALLFGGNIFAEDRSAYIEQIWPPASPPPSFATSAGDTVISYHCASGATFRVPDLSGNLKQGMRFDTPTDTTYRLKSVRVDLFNIPGTAKSQRVDTVNGCLIEIYNDNGSGVPSTLIGSRSISNAQLIAGGWAPGTVKSAIADFSTTNIVLIPGKIFHVATTTIPGDTGRNAVVMESGFSPCPSTRWIEYGPEGPNCPGMGTGWHIVSVCYGDQENLNIYATLSQFASPQLPAVVPALTTYGLLVLAVLILLTGVWTFVRRRTSNA